MLLGSVLAGIGQAAVPEGGGGALAVSGEALGEAVVTGVETHPEYERYALRQPGGGIVVVELTTGTGGLCDVAGLTIFPRDDLSGGATGSAGTEALCARLTERRPTLRARIGEGGARSAARGGEGARQTDGGPPDLRGPGGTPPGEPPTDAGTRPGRAPGSQEVRAPRVYTPLHLVLLGMLALAVGRVRIDRMHVAVAIAALVARLALAPRGITNGNLAGYEKLVLARGTIADSPYGDAWGALMGAVPGWPDGVFAATLGLATVSAVLLAEATRRVAGPAAGLAAGLLFALLPAHVGVSMSETMHVAVLAFELAAVVAALAWTRSRATTDGLVAALATGFAVHLRPDALPFVVVPLALAAIRGGAARGRVVAYALPLVVLAALVGWRLATLSGAPGGVLLAPGLSVLLPRVGEPEEERAFQLFLHAGFTPPVLWGLAGIGAAALWRAGLRRELAVVAGWIAVTTLPVSAKVWPLVDAVRLQLAGQAPWVLLAGVGAAWLPRWAFPILLLGFLPYYPLRPWVQTEEWRFLRAVVPTLPEGSTVRYDARPQRAESFAAVMEELGPSTWSPDAGDLVYVGLDCRDRGGCDTSGCVAERVTRLEGRVDLDLSLEGRTIGFWRCSAPEAGR